MKNFLNHRTFDLQAWNGDISARAEVSCKKYLQGQCRSEASYHQNKIASATSTDPFATKLSVLVHHYQPECLVTWQTWVLIYRSKYVTQVLTPSCVDFARALWTSFCFSLVTWKDWIAVFKVKVMQKSKLHWIFVSPIFFVPLIFVQSN